MKFKQLEIKPEYTGLKRLIKSRRLRKTAIYIAIGAVAGFLYFFFTEGKQMDVITTGNVVKSVLIGGFFGFFIANSPCANNKC